MSKAVLVTGGAKRIGAAMALFLAKEGWDIAIHYFSSKNEAEDLALEIRSLGLSCEIFKSDLSNCKNAEKLIDDVVSVFPNLSVLINSASIFKKKDLFEADLEDIEESLSIHLYSPLLMTRRFAEVVKNGNVINILDTKTEHPDMSRFSYSLGKNGLLDLTKMAAYELAPNIRVNGISPGKVLDPSDGEASSVNIENLPLKKSVSLEGLNSSLKFLIENEDITGQIISVDCGESLLWQ